MANYIGDYFYDLGLIVKGCLISVNLVTNTSLTTFRGNSETTDIDFDNQYLPEIFKVSYRALLPRQGFCNPLQFTRKRFIKAYINTSTYLKIEVGFKPGTFDFNICLEQVKQKNNILTIGFIGERTDIDVTEFLLR